MVKLSHDRLEQSSVTRAVTLRSTFGELKNLLVKSGGELNTDTAGKFLHLLEQYCYLDKAALYLVDHSGQIQTESLASLRGKATLKKDDILVQQCLTNKKANYFSINKLPEDASSDYLVVAPLKTARDTIIALLVIEDMSFWSLNDETLKVMTALLGYFANEKWAINASADLLQKYAKCPMMFAANLYKLIYLTKEMDVPNCAAVFFTDKDNLSGFQLIRNLEKQQRDIDVVWQIEAEKNAVLIVLKPFMLSINVEQYLEELMPDLAQKNVKSFYRVIKGKDSPLDFVQEIMDKSNAV